MDNFVLHPLLEADTEFLHAFDLSDLLLMNNALFPWLILVPRVARDVTEIFQLTPHQQLQLLKESNLVAQLLTDLFEPDKLNIATIGNICPQLHMHHIARFRSDNCWPNPVWGHAERVLYSTNEMEQFKENILGKLAEI